MQAALPARMSVGMPGTSSRHLSANVGKDPALLVALRQFDRHSLPACIGAAYQSQYLRYTSSSLWATDVPKAS